MNKPCLKCGAIMMVPDIPLPKTYTQKCVSCNFVNPVGDDLFYGPESHSAPSPAVDESETDAFDLSQPTQAVESIDFSQPNTSEEDWFQHLDQVQPKSVELEVAFQPQPEQIPTQATSPQPTTPQLSEETLAPYLNRVRNEIREAFAQQLAELDLRVTQLERQAAVATPTQPEPDLPETPNQPDLVTVGEVLLCGQVPGFVEVAQRSLMASGFKVVAVGAAHEAQKLVQEVAFQVIVLDQRFVQGSPEGQALLASIKLIALPIRRHQSVILVTPRIETGESQVFYQWGVDLNVHSDELANLGALVSELIALKHDMLGPYLGSSLDTDRVMT